MDALEALFRPIANLLNRNIGEITPARELCERLDGKTVVIRVRDTALSLTFGFDDGRIQLGAALPEEPDVVIAGSLLTLAKVARGGGQAELRDGSLEVTGNAAVADAFRELLGYAKPDIEEELSGIVGNAAAHRLGELARSLGSWAREARATMETNVREYLQEESRDLPSRYEVERFTRDLNVLRDDVDRAEARLARLEERD
jgi:ubiquinone biosynthesis protein UbiJ